MSYSDYFEDLQCRDQRMASDIRSLFLGMGTDNPWSRGLVETYARCMYWNIQANRYSDQGNSYDHWNRNLHLLSNQFSPAVILGRLEYHFLPPSALFDEMAERGCLQKGNAGRRLPFLAGKWLLW